MGFGLLMMLFSTLIPIGIVVGVIVLLVKAFSNKNQTSKFTEEDGEVMLKNIYMYLVLFATLMMTIGGSVGIFMGVADYIVPQPYVENYESYRMTYTNNNQPANYDPYAEDKTTYQEYEVDESEIRESYTFMKEEAHDEARQSAIKLIIQSMGWIAIPLPIFMYYQKDLKGKNGKKSTLE